jgi:hypothetical protein
MTSLLTLVSFGNLSSTPTASTAASERPEPRLRCAIAAGALLLLLGAVCVPAHAQSNWVQESPATSPPARDYAALAYDAAQGQVVLFGGSGMPGGVLGYFNDTWVWDGTNWTQEFPADSPSARGAFGMTYDAAHGQVVLFGGFGGVGDLNDTWVWDGTDWTQEFPANSPSARAAFVMVYDAAQSQVVLFGGLNGAGDLNDTWVWNGSNWTQLSPANSPSARSDYDMAYDAAQSQVLLFGGLSGPSFLGDTWVWDGTDWTQLSPANSPPARGESPMAYDAALGQPVLFGGNGNGTPLNDTWVWDGTNWTQEFPANSPSARVWSDMAYDPQRSQVVLFGGLNLDFFNDTWVYEPQVTASPTSINFGNVKLRTTKSAKVTLINHGTTKVEIGPISFIDIVGDPGDFSFRESCHNGKLRPGHSCRVEVHFSPSEEAPESATLNIVTNAPGSPLQVPITATGIAHKGCP